MFEGISTLSKSYQERLTYNLEANSPLQVKWFIERIGLIHRICALVTAILFQIPALFSATWEDACLELWARAKNGTVCRRDPWNNDANAYKNLQSSLSLTTSPNNSCSGMGMNFTGLNQQGTNIPSKNFNSSPSTSTSTAAKKTKPTIQPDLHRVLKFTQTDGREIQILIPQNNPQLLNYYLSQGWQEHSLPPSLDPYICQVQEWRSKVIAAMQSPLIKTPAHAKEDQAHQEILPGLFLGGNYVPKEAYTLDKQPMTPPSNYDEIISVCARTTSLTASHRYAFPCKPPANDVQVDSFTVESVSTALGLIDQALRQGKKVLVHCELGQSRSPSIVAMYIAIRTGVSMDNAIQYMRTKRFCASPSSGYINKLQSIRSQVEQIFKDNDHPFNLVDLEEIA